MIAIIFTFLGKEVKVTTEGTHCIDKRYNDNARLKEIREMNNSLLNKNEDKYKEAYHWCEIHSLGRTKKGREDIFPF